MSEVTSRPNPGHVAVPSQLNHAIIGVSDSAHIVCLLNSSAEGRGELVPL